MSVIRIPQSDRQLIQANDGVLSGNLWATWNADLRTSRGKVRVSPRLQVNTSSTDDAQLGYPVAFESHASLWWAACGTVLFKTSADDASGAWTQDAYTGTPTSLNHSVTDMVRWNTRLYVSGETDIYELFGTTWTSWWQTDRSQSPLQFNSGSAEFPHFLVVAFNKDLYITDNNKVYWVQTDETVTTSGNGTLDLSGQGQAISCMRSGSTRLWIGTSSQQKGREGQVYEWDASAQNNDYNRAYNVGAPGVFAMVIKDDIPWIVTSDGALKVFNGAGFTQVAQFPIYNDSSILTNSMDSMNSGNVKWVHPNGMQIVDGKINILVNNRFEGASTHNCLTNMPSGLWEYDEKIGLYHKTSLTVDSAGSKDFGQNGISYAGAIKETKETTASLLVGAGVYTDDESTELKAIFIDDLDSSLKKRGHIVTPQIHSSAIEDTWQKLWLKFKKFESSNEAIVAKYRSEENANLPFIGKVTWTDGDTFTSTNASFANVSAGNEIEVVMGNGSGTTAHVSSISLSGSTYTVNLDETVTGVSASDTGEVRADNWIKLGSISSQNIPEEVFEIGSTDTWVQFKIELRVNSGDGTELDQIVAISKANQQL